MAEWTGLGEWLKVHAQRSPPCCLHRLKAQWHNHIAFNLPASSARASPWVGNVPELPSMRGRAPGQQAGTEGQALASREAGGQYVQWIKSTGFTVQQA